MNASVVLAMFIFTIVVSSKMDDDDDLDVFVFESIDEVDLTSPRELVGGYYNTVSVYVRDTYSNDVMCSSPSLLVYSVYREAFRQSMNSIGGFGPSSDYNADSMVVSTFCASRRGAMSTVIGNTLVRNASWMATDLQAALSSPSFALSMQTNTNAIATKFLYNFPSTGTITAHSATVVNISSSNFPYWYWIILGVVCAFILAIILLIIICIIRCYRIDNNPEACRAELEKEKSLRWLSSLPSHVQKKLFPVEQNEDNKSVTFQLRNAKLSPLNLEEYPVAPLTTNQFCHIGSAAESEARHKVPPSSSAEYENIVVRVQGVHFIPKPSPFGAVAEKSNLVFDVDRINKIFHSDRNSADPSIASHVVYGTVPIESAVRSPKVVQATNVKSVFTKSDKKQFLKYVNEQVTRSYDPVLNKEGCGTESRNSSVSVGQHDDSPSREPASTSQSSSADSSDESSA